MVVVAASGVLANPLAIPDSEYDALIALYNSTNGPNWANNTNWLTANSSWYGVIVSGGHVIWLDLYNNHLSGSIPAELGNLTHLQYLWLDSNQLTGPIPAQLGGIQTLQYLWLDSNQLTGPIPPELGGLANLQSLRLDNNLLSGPIPAELGGPANLQSLYLYNNYLTGSIPDELGNLSKLRWLYLGNNQLSGPIPAELGNLSDLRYFSLNSNNLVGEIPASFAGLTQLIASGSSLGYNALHSTDPAVTAVLDAAAPGWQDTQTVAPAGVSAVPVAGDTVNVSWTPIHYTADDGYYEVGSSDVSGGPYVFLPQNRTAGKSVSSLDVTGLPAGHDFLVVRSVTLPHAHNTKNTVASPVSEEVVTAVTALPKALADGSAVAVSGLVVTAVFQGFFYAESPDRSWGIRVVTAGPAPAPGAVSVTGTMATGANGERFINASSVVVSGPASVTPVGLANRALGGGDWMYDSATGAGQRGVRDGVGPNSIGLLVTIWGEVAASGEGWFYVDDGSGMSDGSGNVGIRVDASGLTAPPEGSIVSVTSISGCDVHGAELVNVLLPRTQADIEVRQP